MEKIIRSPVLSSVARKVGRSQAVAPAAPAAEKVVDAADAGLPQNPPGRNAAVAPSARPAETGPVLSEGQLAALRASIRKELEGELRQELAAQMEAGLEEAREQAGNEGYEEGMKQGREAAQKMAATEVKRLASVADSLLQERSKLLDGEDLLVEIVFTAACRVVGEAALTREVVAGMVNRVAAGFKAQDRLTLRLHPQDLELIEYLAESSDEVRIAPNVSMRADDTVARGGCIADSDAGSLDARLDLQMQRLREALMSARPHQDAASMQEES